jgi:hypothetical protein
MLLKLLALPAVPGSSVVVVLEAAPPPPPPFIVTRISRTAEDVGVYVPDVPELPPKKTCRVGVGTPVFMHPARVVKLLFNWLATAVVPAVKL